MKKKKGFTLIELLVVLVILAILAAVAVPLYTNYTKKAYASEAMGVIGAIAQAAKGYYSSTGSFPTNLDAKDYYNKNDPDNHFTYTYSSSGSNSFTITAKGNGTGGITKRDTITYTYDTTEGSSWTGGGDFEDYPFPSSGTSSTSE
ncbi:MAG: type II secretion system protein [Candidatus Desulfofervidaceae bacterium]|nr:type II secretion system protein [Candidatus Desulfofervidaceae bacterium]